MFRSFSDPIDKINLLRANLFWNKSSTKFSFGLLSGGNEELGDPIEYDSIPSTSDNKDNSYDCSIAFHEDNVSALVAFNI